MTATELDRPSSYKVVIDLVMKYREEQAKMKDGLLTQSTNFHDRHYLESVVDGNSDYWRAKVFMLRKDLVARIGESAFYDFIDSLPDEITYQGIFEEIEKRLKGEITPNFIGEQFRSMME